MSLRDILGEESSADSETAAQDTTLANTHPILHELMTSREKVNAGKRRQVCTLTIVAEDGMWKGGLRERDYQMSLWVSAGSYTGVLDALEEALGRRPVPWRKTAVDQSRNRK